MKKIHKIAIYVLSVPAIFMSIILLLIGQAWIAIALMGGFAFIAYMIYRTSKAQVASRTNDICSVSPLDLISVQHTGLQMLETIYIIENTTVAETLRTRVEFLIEHYNHFVNSSKLDRYKTDIEKAIAKYQLMHYDRGITENQRRLLLSPDEKEVKAFVVDSILSCIEKYTLHQVESIKKLKTEAARKRRTEDLLSNWDEFTSHFICLDFLTIDDINRIGRLYPAVGYDL